MLGNLVVILLGFDWLELLCYVVLVGCDECICGVFLEGVYSVIFLFMGESDVEKRKVLLKWGFFWRCELELNWFKWFCRLLYNCFVIVLKVDCLDVVR